jgi:phosphoglycolate phosphatase-like HAD superfamily hydrolase
LILFDIDGTLLASCAASSNSVHKDSFSHAMSLVFDQAINIDEISHSGKTDVWILRLLCERRGVPESSVTVEALAAAQQAMVSYCAARTEELKASVSCLPGVRELLQRLREEGAVLGLVTGNLEEIARQKVSAVGLAAYFSCGGFGSDAEDRADMIRIAVDRAAKAGFVAKQAWHVGDTPHDIDAASRAGVRGVGVATGHFSFSELAAVPCGAYAIIQDLTGETDDLRKVFAI